MPSLKKILGLSLLTTAAIGVGSYVKARREAFQFKKEMVPVHIKTNGTGGGSKGKTLRILHLSDLHVARNESSRKLSFLQEITDDEYDLVFLTGDIFEHDESILYSPYLLSRKPRLGAYAILGNHDYYEYSMTRRIMGRIFKNWRHPDDKKVRDLDRLVDSLEGCGYKVLRNEGVHLKDDKISIFGIEFPGVPKQELLEITEKTDKEHLKLALFHIPKELQSFSDAGVHMAFGGHTHGGQVRFPVIGAVITDSDLPRKNACGLVNHGDTIFHISRGLGADPRTNFRLNCPPTAYVIELSIT